MFLSLIENIYQLKIKMIAQRHAGENQAGLQNFRPKQTKYLFPVWITKTRTYNPTSDLFFPIFSNSRMPPFLWENMNTQGPPSLVTTWFSNSNRNNDVKPLTIKILFKNMPQA